MPVYKVQTSEGQALIKAQSPQQARKIALQDIYCVVTGKATQEDIDFHIGMGGMNPNEC